MNETKDVYWDNETAKGMKVENGELTLGGKPVYMAGVNSYNLFTQATDTFSEELAYSALKELSDNGVKVVRFNCGGYDYSYIDRYYESRSKWISLLRKIAKKAEEYEIGLIPSFFWLHHAVPDYYDEPICYWGNANSKTVNFLAEYTKTVVEALWDSKAIFGWEFGNEFNLSCDLSVTGGNLPALPPHSKRSSRTSEDYMSVTDASYAFTVFASTIRSVDTSGRMITSGNAGLRSAQYNLWKNNSWAQDTYEQYKQMQSMFTPDGMDCVSDHIYDDNKTFGDNVSTLEYITTVKNTAKTTNKAYYIGEWGGGEHTLDYYANLADTFIEADVQLFLLWNYNYIENSTVASFSGNTDRGRFLLELLRDANETLEKKHK